jgi:polyisoprenoid-binding protein YceI
MTQGRTFTLARFAALVMTVAVLLGGLVAYSYLKPTAVASSPITAIALEPTDTAGDQVVYEIDQATSQARYIIDEVLNGQPVTVVGATDQVAGQVALDLTDLDAAQIGTIQINARTFATDSAQRDRAVQNRILETNTYEYITFEPTEVSGLPASLPVGEQVSFQIDGDLTIRDVTRPVTFDVTLTPVTTDRLAGSATTTVAFADWSISVSNVPLVTGLGTTVTLALDFEAAA